MTSLTIGGVLLTALLHLSPTSGPAPSFPGTVTTRLTAPDVPPAVKAALARLYPGVAAIDWDEEAGKYEASFTHKGQSLSVLLDRRGAVLETETRIPVAQLPADVRQSVARLYPGQAIKEAALIRRAGGQTVYEAEVAGHDRLFDKSGQPVR